MLKFLFKIIIFISIASGFAYYANYLMTGKTPDIPINKPILPDINLSKVTGSISNKFKSIKKKEPVKDASLYKWRDTKGVIHYASEKPSEKINYEEIIFNNSTNLVPAVSDSETVHENPSQQPSPSTNLPTNIYSPEGIKHLFDQANDIQNLMNDQFTQQENSINNE
jgi:uncharacterized protein DUF4124